MSMFDDVDMSQVKTGTTQKQKQPVWENHAAMAPYENDEFSFRTIGADFAVGGVSYKVSCFQMKAGYFERNSNVEGILKFAQMINHIEKALTETGLSKDFGIDCSTFKQDQGKASRNLCIYIMPRLRNGIRSYIDALTQDMVKSEPETETSPSTPPWTSRKRQNRWGNQ